ncbi:hypothetical protein UlMin_026163 [Ulmus minor]
MEAQPRTMKARKPLSDCTNTVAASSSGAASSQSSFPKSKNPSLSSAFKRIISDTDRKSANSTKIRSVSQKENASLPPPQVISTPTRRPRLNYNSGNGDCEVIEPCSVFSRRRLGEKEKNNERKAGDESFEPCSVYTRSRTAEKGKNNEGKAGDESFEPSSVYTHRRTAEKGKNNEGKAGDESFEPCSVYTRRMTAEKGKNNEGKTVDESLSCLLTALRKKSKEKAGDEPPCTRTALRRKSKGRAIDEPLSCPPPSKIQKIGNKIMVDGSNGPSKASTVPPKKKQARNPRKKVEHALSQDFVDEKRAYFAEIDAFELEEEEVDSEAQLD